MLFGITASFPLVTSSLIGFQNLKIWGEDWVTLELPLGLVTLVSYPFVAEPIGLGGHPLLLVVRKYVVFCNTYNSWIIVDK